MHICRLAGDDGVVAWPDPVDWPSGTVTPAGVDSSTTEPIRLGGIDLATLQNALDAESDSPDVVDLLVPTERLTTADRRSDNDETILG